MKLSDLDVLLTPAAQPVPGLVTRWGTVTGVSPLRVRLDGDDTALPVTPATLVAGLKTDDRVACILSGRQLTVAGVYGGQPASPIAAGSLWGTSTSLSSGTWAKITFSNSAISGGVTFTDGGLKVPTDGWYAVTMNAQLQDVGWGAVGDLFEVNAYSASGGASAAAGGPYGPWTRKGASGIGYLTAGAVVHAWANIYRTGGATLDAASLSVARLG